MRIFCTAKDSHIFQTKNNCICNINVLNFNETLTNDVVNFEQPAPGGRKNYQLYGTIHEQVKNCGLNLIIL